MIIYMIIKIMVSYFLIIKKQWIKDSWKVDLSMDIMIIFIFIWFILMNGFDISKTLRILLLGSMMVLLFMFFKLLEIIWIKMEKILSWIDKKEEMKKILLNPIVNKIIYYGVWLLPWNILYWIYFWMLENGWYFRVWISSNRDVLFWKYFKWDSRDFFYKLNAKINDSKVKWWIRNNILDRIYIVIFRILILLYMIRSKLIEMNIMKYLWIRIIVYMYLCIFYLCFTIYLHELNNYLFWLVVILELFGLVFLEKLISYIEKKWDMTELHYLMLKEKGIVTQEFIELKNRLVDPLFINTRLKFEVNIYIWDKTLSNSITLNILYQYMIWVNKNTKGYFDKQMHIRSRIHRMKVIEEKSIIWDVLPRTRYVIVTWKYFGYQLLNENIINGVPVGLEYSLMNLCRTKNFYLAYYEKTYLKTSLLMFLWMLRFHKKYMAAFERTSAKENGINDDLNKFYRLEISSGNISYKMIILYYFLLDKRYCDENIMFSYLLSRHTHYYGDADYMHYYQGRLIMLRKEAIIPDEFSDLKEYKLMFKIMGRIQLYEEEGVVWNERLQELLKVKEQKYKDALMKTAVSEIENFMYYRFLTYGDEAERADLDLAIPDESYVNGKVLAEMQVFFKKTEPELEEIVNLISEGSLILLVIEIKVKETMLDEIEDEYKLFHLYHSLIIAYEGSAHFFKEDVDEIFKYYHQVKNVLKEYNVDFYAKCKEIE